MDTENMFDIHTYLLWIREHTFQSFQ